MYTNTHHHMYTTFQCSILYVVNNSGLSPEVDVFRSSKLLMEHWPVITLGERLKAEYADSYTYQQTKI